MKRRIVQYYDTPAGSFEACDISGASDPYAGSQIGIMYHDSVSDAWDWLQEERPKWDHENGLTVANALADPRGLPGGWGIYRVRIIVDNDTRLRYIIGKNVSDDNFIVMTASGVGTWLFMSDPA